MSATSSSDATRARAALAQASSADLASARDRRVHGLATAGFGLLMGVYVATSRLVDGSGWGEGVLAGLYLVTLVGLAFWQRRAASTVPRNARQIGYVGVGASAALVLVSILWLNVRQGDNRTAGIGDQPDHWWVYAIVGIVSALPSLVAGYAIFAGRRR